MDELLGEIDVLVDELEILKLRNDARKMLLYVCTICVMKQSNYSLLSVGKLTTTAVSRK